MKLHYLSVALAVTLFTGTSAFAITESAMSAIRTAQQAKALPEKATVMMACGGCQTIKPIDKAGIAAWFGTKVKHDCPSCGGKVTFRDTKGGANTKYVHTCSMCGDASAYVCASH